ncbi:MAG: acyl-CoA dehydrogenase family protein [Pseudomonadota bacterium]
MDFALSETQREVQQLARQILSDQVTAESLSQYDEFATPRFDTALWKQLAEAGLLGVALEESHGGMGLGFFELALLVEEAGRVLAPLPLLSHAVAGALTVQAFGSETQKAKVLPGTADGSRLLTALLNSDPNAPLPMAIPDGSGFRLNGTVTPVPFADSAELMLCPATTEAGPVVLIVPVDASGVALTPIKTTTYEPQQSVSFTDVAVAAEHVLATAERGAAAVAWMLNHCTAAFCAHQLGVTDVAMRMTASYTAEREQFGVPIATFQAVGHRAANCFIDVECLRLNTYQAVSLLDAGGEATTEVQIAKVWAGDVGHRVSYASQHLHGGTGIDRDYPLWRYCLWARANETMLGGSARQLAALGSRIALGEANCR